MARGRFEHITFLVAADRPTCIADVLLRVQTHVAGCSLQQKRRALDRMPGSVSAAWRILRAYGRVTSTVRERPMQAEEGKRGPDDVRRLDERLRRIIASVDGIVWELEVATFCFTFVSEKAERLLGYPLTAWYRRNFWVDILHAEDREWAVRFCQERTRCMEPHEFEYRVVAQDGRIVWLRDIVSVVVSEGAPVRLRGIMVDITRRKQAEAESTRLLAAEQTARAAADAARAAAERVADALRVSEAKLRLAQDAARMGTWELDLATGEVVVSDRCKELFGLPADAVTTYERAIATVHPEDRDRIERALKDALLNRNDYAEEMRITLPDGVRWIASRGRGIYGTDGRPVKMAGMVLDITQAKRTEEELREADRRKTEFLAMLSHELRNPLAPIATGVHLLERVPSGGEQASRAREVIKRQTQHLTRLVDDLLDVTRISRGKIELHRKRIDLCEVVHRSCDDHRAGFEDRELTLSLVLPAEQVWIEADATRISQVLGNMLLNAAKFTPAQGSISVGVERNGDRALIHVRDSGIGMEHALVDRIFEPFVQAERGLARTQGGLGLGLAFAKGLVELHGGSISARSEGPGRGSEFTVSLPLAQPLSLKQPDARRSDPARGRLVLIIEDNADTCEMLAGVLEVNGHRTHVARDGRTGIALARELKPDVVLCDIGLPDVDGYDVARALRADESLRNSRLIAISGYAQLQDQQRAREAGFEAHLAKPPPIDELNAFLAH